MSVLTELQQIKDLILRQSLASKVALNFEEAVEHTKIPAGTMRMYVSKGLVPHSKRGRLIFFDRVELEKWLLSEKVTTQQELNNKADNYLLRKSFKQ